LITTPRRFFAAVCLLEMAAGLLAPLSLRAAEYDQRIAGLSTRGLAGGGSNVMIAGFVIQAGAPKTVMIRALGPGLAAQGVSQGTLADPLLTLYDSKGNALLFNDNWSAADESVMRAVGLTPPVRGSLDASIVVTLPAGVYTAQVSAPAGATGIVLLEVYDVSGPSRLMAISTRAPVGSGGNVLIAGMIVSPGTLYRRLVLRAGGPMLAPLLPGTTILSNPTMSVIDTLGRVVAINDDWDANGANASGQISAAFAQAGMAPLTPGSRDAALVLDLPPGAYTILAGNVDASTGVGLVEAYDITPDGGLPSDGGAAVGAPIPTLYVANLRPTNAAGATGYGTATIQLSADEKSAIVGLTFYSLTGRATSAHLVIAGNFISGLPTTQASGLDWTITPTGTYSVADIVAALKSGRVYVSIDTAANPAGELLGTFARTSGAAIFTLPEAVPAVSLTTVSAQDAARFLNQATFGPTTAEIAALRQRGYAGWITDQLAQPATLHLPATGADFAAYTQNATTTASVPSNRQAAWWRISVTAPDQLRQRVAFALSEIFVISDQNTTINGATDGAANYYDLLARGAFGNFRQLLEDVTLSPMMGIYLSSLRNGKGTFDAQGKVVTSADENYAREVMQLFTIGLRQLQPDGTLKLDSTGQPIATYDQTTISEMAKVFTGWAFASTLANPNFRSSTADYLTPMRLYSDFHDTTAKTIVDGRVIPANQGGVADLRMALDGLFQHANTGPFFARQMIQRLVTSNPSPGYVYRVAQVFANNGSGVRGDIGAVVRAILLDYEARSPALLANAAFGKLKEPLLRATAMFRALGGGSNSGRINISSPDTLLAQASLRSPTVFNFFEPAYVLPGLLSQAGMYAPEFQILTDTTAITIPNFYYTYIYTTRTATDPNSQTIGLTLDFLLPLARTPGPLVDQLDQLLAGATLSQAAKDRVIAALNAVPGSTSDLERVRAAVYLIMTTAGGAVQK
jgi:uncharacterized protein (DUF1800 family)